MAIVLIISNATSPIASCLLQTGMIRLVGSNFVIAAYQILKLTFLRRSGQLEQLGTCLINHQVYLIVVVIRFSSNEISRWSTMCRGFVTSCWTSTFENLIAQSPFVYQILKHEMSRLPGGYVCHPPDICVLK